MAKPNKRQAKREERTMCEYLDCSTTFGRKTDRRRHMKEQHGPPKYCYYPCCKFVTSRIGKLKVHLSKVHYREVTVSLTVPPEFLTATAQFQACAINLSSLEYNNSSNFIPTIPPTLPDYAFTPQFQPNVVEPHAAPKNEPASPSEYKYALPSSVASRKGRQATPNHVYRTCRFRRRPSCPTARTSSARPSWARLGSANESTPDFYSSEQGSQSLFTQWMECAMQVEPITGLLGSLNLEIRLAEDANYERAS